MRWNGADGDQDITIAASTYVTRSSASQETPNQLHIDVGDIQPTDTDQPAGDEVDCAQQNTVR